MIVIACFCAGCSVQFHAGNGNPQAGEIYANSVKKPFQVLTTAASDANQTCAGGSRPSLKLCYSNTNTEIASARALERVLRSVRIPEGYARANKDLLQGLTIWVQGLVARNKGLAARSDSQYSQSFKIINEGLKQQKTAIAEYPSSANITG